MVYSSEKKTLCIASPYLKHGSIGRYLENNPNVDRTLLVLDIAQALEFLHCWHPPIVHTDIKGDNILISDSERACLIDFGFATVKDSLPARISSTMGSIFSTPWTAPEILKAEVNVGHKAYTSQSDMYAFGGVCYELFFGQAPFHGIPHAAVPYQIMIGKTPTRTGGKNVDDKVWDFMEKCWRKAPADRPVAQNAVEFFSARASIEGSLDTRPVVAWDYSILDNNLTESGLAF